LQVDITLSLWERAGERAYEGLHLSQIVLVIARDNVTLRVDS